ncbi:response regulator [Sphingomonas qilianensis]|uniref:Response regulator n=1 Tax=Sphingomonas qilianensis TaxID=1736690 RepID=A0ABU9XRX6_9SPHN
MHVLIVEDEYFLAKKLTDALGQLGAHVVGPFGSVKDALKCVAAKGRIDAAVLDLNLAGEMTYGIADALRARGVPFVLTTGYDEWSILESYRDIPRCTKPFTLPQLLNALSLPNEP